MPDSCETRELNCKIDVQVSGTRFLRQTRGHMQMKTIVEKLPPSRLFKEALFLSSMQMNLKVHFRVVTGYWEKLSDRFC